MRDFEPLIGEWRTDGTIPIQPPITLSGDAKIERLGAFIVFRSVGGAA